MAPQDNHLLVFGASGVSGWACVKEALTFPTKDTFSKVTGLTNRPLSLADSKLPQNDGRLQLISGIDLTAPIDQVVSSMKQKIPSVDTVTHVIFTAYIEKPNLKVQRDVNTELVKTAITAIDQVASGLQAVTLQTGGKAYGVEFSKEIELNPPFKESQPRIEKPYYDNIFYYPQHDFLASFSRDKSWTFSEIRPDVIIGFTPGSNYMNCAQGLGLWLSLYREVHGEDAEIPFPGTEKSWKNKHTDTFQDVLGKMDIYAAVNYKKCGEGGTFNCADGEVVTWEQKWPGICAFFGLKGTPPNASSPYSIEDFIKSHFETWKDLAEKKKLKQDIMENFSWPFLYFVMTVFDFDRQYDLSAAREVGFQESIDTVKGYTTAFERMREAKIIP